MDEKKPNQDRSVVATRAANSPYWVVIRQDTHGTRFDVAEFATREQATARMAKFEQGYPHHQTYFVEQRRRSS